MGVFAWVEFGILLLKLATGILSWVKERQAIEVGRQQVIAEALAETARRLGLSNEVRANIDAMSEAEVDAKLKEQGDFRD